MKTILQHLQNRNSAPRLTAPGPDGAALEQMFASAMRAPDHCWLTPWRFLVVEGQARDELGVVFEQALRRRSPEADAEALEKARNAPLRAPLMIVVICSVAEHPKVPRDEQLISAGCAAYGLLLSAEALGYAGIWRTGDNAFDPAVAAALQLKQNEEIVGFLYFGSRDGRTKSLPEREVEQHVSYWRT